MRASKVSAILLNLAARLHSRMILRELRESLQKVRNAEDFCCEIAEEIECLRGDLRDAQERAAELMTTHDAKRRMAEAELNEIRKITRPPPPAGSVPQVIDKRVGS